MRLKINPVLCRAGTMDNYAYILTDTETNTSAIVDASEAGPVVKRCEELQLKPQFVFTTHHHFDHVGGNEAVKKRYGLKVVGPEKEKNLIPGFDQGVKSGDVFKLGNIEAEIIEVPGHTLGHILWYFPKEKALFTGDTLFNLCIGGLFEGTPEMMWQSLQKIKALPDDVNFFPGHEYTAQCLDTALRENSSPEMNEYAKRAVLRLGQGIPVAPVELGVEKRCNPYLRITRETDFANLF